MTLSSGLKKAARVAGAQIRDPQAIRMLKQDHRQVEAWFDEFEKARQGRSKQALFRKIALALKVHTRLEEQLFYPALRGEADRDMLDEAPVEHDGARRLIADIEKMKPGDALYDARVTVLSEYIRHHVKEEESTGGLFAQARLSGLDFTDLGERMQGRKRALEKQMAARAARKAA